MLSTYRNPLLTTDTFGTLTNPLSNIFATDPFFDTALDTAFAPSTDITTVSPPIDLWDDGNSKK